ncbi:GntR family transcriptional regulator / MocR family aminotransferase [Thermomonospora echinospora]|uniref:GntR family transcriptional regulator / MocR family aminotransferase n=1 Tax=Thermomonospora echinospora TaxID=1992 RepID=A0A1H6B7I4_9ACTN|nr:PLP-dependent aminotransferase family protein [Thermomonospora echinospora]SEG56809.1 GntR family transcriptional regulator / MocR family aminotransferase [Thermomonospora echinospora]
MATAPSGGGPRVQPDLPLLVDRTAAESLTAQLTGQLRTAIKEGRLTSGERLSSSRALAAVLGVSRTVVMDAYAQLYAEGWLEGRHGSGTYVADVSPEAPGTAPLATGDEPTVPGVRRNRGASATATGYGGTSMSSGVLRLRTSGDDAEPIGHGVAGTSGGCRGNGEAAPEGATDLRPGVPWAGGLDTPAWRRAWRTAASIAPGGRSDPWGLDGLREALCEHMRRSRGVACQAEQVVVTRGTTNALDMLAATVLRPGDRVGVEEPGYLRARSVLAARGAEVVPCPVDEHGLVVDGLPDGLRLVYTTPSHQYPLGGVLPVPRRQALLAWARRTGALIAEDDYDGEFRYDVAPLPALYGMDPRVVVYLGTMSKRLAADIGVGWLAARPDLAEAVAARRLDLGDRTAVVPQEAVRLLLERGDLDRHIRRVRAEYARRRAMVVEVFAGLPLRGDTAGLHLVVELPAEVVARVVARAGQAGVLLDTLERHYGGRPSVTGLVIGYSAAPTARLRAGCLLVRGLIDDLTA